MKTWRLIHADGMVTVYKGDNVEWAKWQHSNMGGMREVVRAELVTP